MLRWDFTTCVSILLRLLAVGSRIEFFFRCIDFYNLYSTVYYKFRIDKNKLNEDERKTIRNYFIAIYSSFSDSQMAFKIAHALTKRCETEFLNNEYSFYEHCKKFDLNPNEDNLKGKLARFHTDCYSLHQELCISKFGPNYVKFKTPVTNVRLTSYFSGEYEVQVINPDLLEEVEAHGCNIVIQ